MKMKHTITMKWDRDLAQRPVVVGQAAIERSAEDILRLANLEVPVATGELRDSGHVETRGGRSRVVYDAPHAIVVHQRLDVRHVRGRAKWLELTFLEEQRNVAGRVTDAVRKATG